MESSIYNIRKGCGGGCSEAGASIESTDARLGQTLASVRLVFEAAIAAVNWLPLLQEIADRADVIALRLFRSAQIKVDEKPDLSPVTEADRQIEDAARAVVRERSPELGVFGEEEGETDGREDRRLIIDPIDATRNFIRGIPVFATLLAIEDHGEIVAGVVSAPALQTRWSAARGYGAFCGERRLTVSTIEHTHEAQIFHGDIAGNSEDAPPPGALALLRSAHRTRGFGDFYQHLLVAEGAGELAIDPVVHPWDVAALQVIVEEAGGRATGFSGERSIYEGSLLTSNGLLHRAALDTLNS